MFLKFDYLINHHNSTSCTCLQTNINIPHKFYYWPLQGRRPIMEHLHIRNTFQPSLKRSLIGGFIIFCKIVELLFEILILHRNQGIPEISISEPKYSAEYFHKITKICKTVRESRLFFIKGFLKRVLQYEVSPYQGKLFWNF